MAILSNKTFLMRKANGGSTFDKLTDITSYPDIGGAPDTIDVTTLSDMVQRNINGIQTAGAHEFGAWYEKEVYETLQAIQEADLTKTREQLDTYQLWFGEDGVYGKFQWQGKLSVFAGGAESNAARPMTITISDEGEEPMHLIADVSG